MNRDTCEHFTPSAFDCEYCPPKSNKTMTKTEIIQMIKLLSAMESVLLAQGNSIPDYLHDQLLTGLEILERECLK